MSVSRWWSDEASLGKLHPSHLACLAQASFKQRVKGCYSHLPTRQTEFCKGAQMGQRGRSGRTTPSTSELRSSPSILPLFFKTSFTICSEGKTNTVRSSGTITDGDRGAAR